MPRPEVVLNLWYVHDDMGVIYSLRARAYVAVGGQEETYQMLRSAAEVDYLIAKPFPIPDRFHVEMLDDGVPRKMPVFHQSALGMLDSPIALFEDAIKTLENEMPAQSEMTIPEDPMVCVTPLAADDSGGIRPCFSGTQRFPEGPALEDRRCATWSNDD